MFFYSASNNGFYSADWHGENIPSDAVEITAEEHAHLHESGMRIAPDESGRPILLTPTLTAAEIESAKVALVQQFMDDAARTLRYDSIANAITYADEPAVPKFQVEGQAFRAWRSLVWATCYAILAQVQAGERGIPTDGDLIDSLPPLNLPEVT